jgi:hypothetical protein
MTKNRLYFFILTFIRGQIVGQLVKKNSTR